MLTTGQHVNLYAVGNSPNKIKMITNRRNRTIKLGKYQRKKVQILGRLINKDKRKIRHTLLLKKGGTTEDQTVAEIKSKREYFERVTCKGKKTEIK